MPEPGTNQSQLTTGATSAPSTSNGTNGAAGGGAAFTLPPDVAKQYPGLSKFKDLASLAKSYGEMEKSYGSSLRVPSADATDEERSAFYSKLGRPESPDKYEIKFAEGTQVDDKLLSSFRGAAHKIGLTPGQAQALGEWWAGQTQGMNEAAGTEIKGDMATWEKDLNTAWGWKTDQNITLAARALNRMTEGWDETPALKEFLDETGLGNHPLMIKLFHQIALKSGEDKLITAETGPTADDRQTAKEQISAIREEARKDPHHPFRDIRHPEHKEWLRRMSMLYETANAKEE